jgi:hypothetical protein
MKVLDPKAFDAILGYDWLQQYSPMICHWKNKTMSFTLQGKQIELQGVLPPPKWCACNEIGAFAIVEPMPEDSKQNHVPEVQQLFQEFQDVLMTLKHCLRSAHWIIQFHYFQMLFLSIPDLTATYLCTKMR